MWKRAGKAGSKCAKSKGLRHPCTIVGNGRCPRQRYQSKDGFVLLYKRLESGSFQWPRNGEKTQKLTPRQSHWLMEGYIRYYNTRRVQRNLGILTPMEKHELCLAA